MQPYVNPNYFTQYQQPQINPYQQRMDFLQNYQQSLQPSQQMPVQGNQMNVMGKIVDSIDVVRAMDIPADGKMYYFPKADGTEIFGKQWIVTEGRTIILSFKPILETETNNSSCDEEKLKNEPFREFTEAFEKRFDKLEKQINDLMTKSMTKSPVSKTKKESADNE